MGTARDTAVAALVQWEREQTYSNIMLDNLLKDSNLSASDAAFTTRLVYGVIERLLTIDWLLEKNSRQSLKKCHPTVRAVLRTAVYQLVFMEKIPSSAAVNEAVKQVKRSKASFAAGFVNGVLRAVEREAERLLASIPHDLKGESLRHSVPQALLKTWERSYGREHAVALAAASNEAPPTVIRINTLKGSREAFLTCLEANGVRYAAVDGLPDALCVEQLTALRQAIPDSTRYYLQDTASQWAVTLLAPQAGERILDLCAAPGGKSFTAAQHMNNRGSIVACDIYEQKVNTVASRARDYGIGIVETVCRDASSALPEAWRGMFDRVICDVPCSGFGVIRRRPEIRYKSPDSFEELAALQYAILCRAAQAVKPGGVIQYSTCTLRPEENERIVERFLAEHPSFEEMPVAVPPITDVAPYASKHGVTMMPHVHGTDGFFAAKLRRKDSL